MQKEKPGHSGASLLQARFLMKEGKVREAVTILQGLNRDFPGLPDPYFYLGVAHYSLGEIDFAQQALWPLQFRKMGKIRDITP